MMVWHTSNGKWYHKGPKCGSMSNASQHTVASAVKKGLTACPYCHPIDDAWVKKDDPTVYVSTDNYWHTRTGCESNTGEWTIMKLDDARKDASLRPCDACGARYYVDGVPENVGGSTLAPVVTNAPATKAPESTGGSLNLGKVTNGDALVYYSANTSHYHRRDRCSTSTTTTFLPHTLMDALLEGKFPCPVCRPPEAATE